MWSEFRFRILGLLGQGIEDLDLGLTIDVQAKKSKNIEFYQIFKEKDLKRDLKSKSTSPKSTVNNWQISWDFKTHK